MWPKQGPSEIFLDRDRTGAVISIMRLHRAMLQLVRLRAAQSMRLRIDHANDGIILLLPFGPPAPGGNSRPLKPDGTPGLLLSNGSDLGVELSPSSKMTAPHTRQV